MNSQYLNIIIKKEIIYLIAKELLEIKNLACFKISVVFIKSISSIQGMNPINLFGFKIQFGLVHHANASKDFYETTFKKSAMFKKNESMVPFSN